MYFSHALLLLPYHDLDKVPCHRALYRAEYVRFNELKRQLNGITDMMLTKILKELVKENIVTRVQYNEIPPRAEYSLTPNGLNLVNALNEVTKWSKGTHNISNSK